MTRPDVQFKTDGLVCFRNLLHKDAVDELIAASISLHRSSGPQDECPFKWDYPHAVSKEESLWGCLSQPALLDAAQHALQSDRIAYLEHSDLKVWRQQPASGWHRDSISDRFGEGPEWDNESYRVVRVGIYLQGADQLFEWGCIPGSHALENPVDPATREFCKKEKLRPGRVTASRLSHLKVEDGRLWISSRAGSPGPTEPVWLATAPGDVILFDPRLIHVGGHVPGFKRAVFFALGVPNGLSDLHRHHFGGAEFDRLPDGTRLRFIRFLESAGLALR